MSTSAWLNLDGRPALVAGAGGLGSACAVSLAEVGAQVVLLDISPDNLAGASDEAARRGVGLTTHVADLGSADACRSAVADAVGLLGGLDVFVHAVGRNVRVPVLDLPDEEWDATLSLNLSTAFWLGQAAGRLLTAQAYGRMVFVSSVSGLLAHAHHAPYAASKGGLNQLLKVMAREWAGQGVTVNAVAPGYIETDLTRAYLDTGQVRADLTRLVPAGRLGVPKDVADAVAFLASDRAEFVTGQVLYVDGGRVLV